MNKFEIMSVQSLQPKTGNLTKEGTTRYLVWGHNDKPVIFYNRVGNATPTVFTHYFYNAAGDRVKKLTRKGQKLEVTVYACPERSRRVDGGLFELSYTKPTGTTIDADRHYNTLYLKDGNSTIASGRVGTNVDDGTPAIKYTIDDHLGNSTVLLNSNGNLVNREEYYPFGETAFGAYAFKRYRFNGKEKDEESGLYNYGQRYYAPWLCRFVSVDPIAEDYPQLSSYNYAGNKPVTSPDIDGLQGTEDKPQKITDGAGRESLIDQVAQIVDGDTAVLSQEGDKFVNVNGVGLVKESLIDGVSGIPLKFQSSSANNLTGFVLSETIPDASSELGKYLENRARQQAIKKVSEGTMIGTNDKVYQSSGRTKTGHWAHKGNQYFTTKGIDPLKHPKLLGWQNVAGKGLKSLGQIGGTVIGAASLIADERQNPFSLLPISFATDTQMEGYDQLDQDFLDMAISQGYESVKRLIAGQRGNSNNLAIKDLLLEDVQPDVLWNLLEGNYSSYESLLDAIYSADDVRSYGVLIKFTHEAPGFQTLGVFNIPNR